MTDIVIKYHSYFITKCDSFITKWDGYYKMRRSCNSTYIKNHLLSFDKVHFLRILFFSPIWQTNDYKFTIHYRKPHFNKSISAASQSLFWNNAKLSYMLVFSHIFYIAMELIVTFRKPILLITSFLHSVGVEPS